MELVSFVIPCYRSEKTIRNVVLELQQIMAEEKSYDYEIILVNDDSPDDVWSVIQELCTDNRVKAIAFSKNFGQASAVMAGYANASGDYVFTMDDDGQSPADYAMKLLEEMKKEEYDAVYGITTQAQFNLYRKIGSKINAAMAKIMFGRPVDKRTANICAARKYIIKEMCRYQDPYPYLSGLLYRSTGKIGYVPVKHRARLEGTSGYSFKRLLSVWMNGFTAFSIKPLRMASWLGLTAAAAGLAGCIAAAVYKIVKPQVAVGWSSIICVILLMGGINLIVLGLIGEYLGRMYMSQNETPQYVIRKSINICDTGADGRE